MNVLGLDIGGANIKAADSAGMAMSFPYPLWKKPKQLAEFLRDEVITLFPAFGEIAITMTGELCDCFESKSSGVHCILKAVEEAAPHAKSAIYTTRGEFVDPVEARERPLEVAASNWHALASFALRFQDRSDRLSLLVDIGSTTTDLIPLSDHVEARGSTDTTRIQNHELVYTGSSRTPVCAVCNQITFRGQHVPVAQEVFATMADVYTFLGDREENPLDQETADGRALTKVHCQRRLARMLCADREELTSKEVLSLATQIKEKQVALVTSAIRSQMKSFCSPQRPLNSFLVSGSGCFVFDTIRPHFPKVKVIHLNEKLGSSLSAAAPAYAVAKLLEEKK